MPPDLLSEEELRERIKDGGTQIQICLWAFVYLFIVYSVIVYKICIAFLAFVPIRIP